MIAKLTSRRIRLISGCTLFAYLACHLVNHTIGLVSLRAAEEGLSLAMAFWWSWPGTVALYGAAAVHFSLALWTLFHRGHWDLPLVEWLRLAAGFSLPPLLIGHAVSTRLSASLYASNPNYTEIVGNLWASGAEGWQIALLAPGWIHGCLGLWLSLRRYEPMRRARNGLIAFMIVMPLLSAAGFVTMAREIAALGPRPPAEMRVSPDVRRAGLTGWRENLLTGYWLLVFAAFASGRVRTHLRARRNSPVA